MDDLHSKLEEIEVSAKAQWRIDVKAVVKEAIKEWLDEKLRQGNETIGKWFVRACLAIALAAIAYLIITARAHWPP